MTDYCNCTINYRILRGQYTIIVKSSYNAYESSTVTNNMTVTKLKSEYFSVAWPWSVSLPCMYFLPCELLRCASIYGQMDLRLSTRPDPRPWRSEGKPSFFFRLPLGFGDVHIYRCKRAQDFCAINLLFSRVIQSGYLLSNINQKA